MKCIRCGRNVRTSAEERNFFRGMGYYSPMYWVRDQGLDETLCKAEGLDPNDSEHFLCFDCYYDLMEKQRDEYLKNKDFGPIKIKGTFKESKNLKESTQEERDQEARDLIESPYNNLQEEDFEWLREKDETLDYWWNQTYEMEFLEKSLYDGPTYADLDESKEVSFEFSNNADADEFIDDVKARYHYPTLRNKHEVDKGGITPRGGKVYFKGAIARPR